MPVPAPRGRAIVSPPSPDGSFFLPRPQQPAHAALPARNGERPPIDGPPMLQGRPSACVVPALPAAAPLPSPTAASTPPLHPRTVVDSPKYVAPLPSALPSPKEDRLSILENNVLSLTQTLDELRRALLVQNVDAAAARQESRGRASRSITPRAVRPVTPGAISSQTNSSGEKDSAPRRGSSAQRSSSFSRSSNLTRRGGKAVDAGGSPSSSGAKPRSSGPAAGSGNSTRGNGPVASAQVGLPYPAETHRVVVAHSYSAADSAALHDRHQRAVRSVRGITTPEVARLRDFVHPPSALLPYAKVLSVLTNALPRRTTPADLYTDSKDAWAAPWRALKPLLGSRPMADILSSIGPRDVPPDVIRYMEETLPGEPPLQTLERISFAAAALGEFVHSLFSLCEAHRGVRVFHGGPAKPRRASASSRSGSSAGCASDAGDAARRRAPSAPVPTARSNPRNQPSDGPGPAPRARRAAPRTRSPAASNKPRPAKKPARAAAAAAAAAAAPPEVCAEPKPLPLAPQPSRAVPDASFTKQQQQQQEQEQQHQHRQTQALDPMHLAPSSAPSAQAAQQGAGVGGGAHRSRVVLSPAVPAMPLHAERPPTQQLQQQPPPPQQQRRSVISPPIPAEFRQSSPQQYRDVVARPAPPAAQPPLQPPRARHSPDLSPSSHDGGGFAADVQPSRSGPGPAAERSVFSPVKSAQFPAAAALHQQQQGSRTVAEGRAAHGRGGGVVAWLTSLGLAPYAAVFEENEIDLDAVSLLTDKDLDDMGIPLGPKKKILHARPMA